MKTLVVYESKFGNTERLARAVAQKLEQNGPVDMVNASRRAIDTSGIDLLVFGGPTQGHGVGPAAREALDELETEALKGVLVAAFDTRLKWLKWLSGSAAVGLAKRLEEKGGRLIVPAESFIVSGSKGPLAEGEMERAEAWATDLANNAAKLLPASAEVRKTA